MIIDGKKISESVLEGVKKDAEKLNGKGIIPGLAVIMVGNNPASKTYVRNKKMACEKAGIKSEEYLLPENASEKEILNLIDKLNATKEVSGILVQLPLPSHLDSKTICERISPLKDVDAFTSKNIGDLFKGDAKFLPCTPAGIIEILKHENINLAVKHCVIIGRSNIVGKPLALLLIQNDATVTVCHSKTKNLEEICKLADIVICAVGKEKFLKKEMVKPGAVVIDVGINRDENGKLCGDADFENLEPICSKITPVPGGVGPMTVAMLVKNAAKAAEIQNKRN